MESRFRECLRKKSVVDLKDSVVSLLLCFLEENPRWKEQVVALVVQPVQVVDAVALLYAIVNHQDPLDMSRRFNRKQIL